jgi:tRNA (mo5U34)-methyltransferase
MKPPAAYAPLRNWVQATPGFGWLLPLIDESERLLASNEHGDLATWREVLAMLPQAGQHLDGARPAPRLGRSAPRPLQPLVEEALRRLHPWRKGPLEVAGICIDTEWRSNWKWDRVAGSVELSGHRVLDVGSGNGYYGWRMLAGGAECVVGIDPTLVYVMQWLACGHFAGEARNFVLPLGIEAVPAAIGCFDTVCSMGVLYHRKNPVDHLAHLASLLRPGAGCATSVPFPPWNVSVSGWRRRAWRITRCSTLPPPPWMNSAAPSG